MRNKKEENWFGYFAFCIPFSVYFVGCEFKKFHSIIIIYLQFDTIRRALNSVWLGHTGNWESLILILRIFQIIHFHTFNVGYFRRKLNFDCLMPPVPCVQRITFQRIHSANIPQHFWAETSFRIRKFTSKRQFQFVFHHWEIIATLH